MLLRLGLKTIMAVPTSEIASVKLLSHASVKITAGKTAILTDPWFFGRVFNNGWGLSPEPSLDYLKKELANVTHIWISHEHPDHLHFPSLKFLFDEVGLQMFRSSSKTLIQEKYLMYYKRLATQDFFLFLT